MNQQITRNAIQIIDCPNLTTKEVENYSKKILEGDENALNEFSLCWDRLILKIIKSAKDYLSFKSNVYDEELFQDGRIYIIQLAKSFDYRKGVRFQTYVYENIKFRFIDYLKDINKKRTVSIDEDSDEEKQNTIMNEFYTYDDHYYEDEINFNKYLKIVPPQCSKLMKLIIETYIKTNGDKISKRELSKKLKISELQFAVVFNQIRESINDYIKRTNY